LPLLPRVLTNLWERKDAVSAPVSARPTWADSLSRAPAYGLFLSPAEITPHHAWLLYENVATLAKVVDLIADQVAGLHPIVTHNEQAVNDDGTIATFFDNPGYNRDRRRLIKELAVQMLVTGTTYLCVNGNPRFTPVSLDVFKTGFVNPTLEPDMWPGQYIYAEGSRSERFDRIAGRDFRWIGTSGFSELIPIYDIDGNRRGIGLSRLSAIKKDVELRISGTQHNTNMMQNGARPSGALVFKDRLNTEQKQDVGSHLQHTIVGAGNAGRVMLFSGGEAEFIQMSQTAKDMDWTNLVKSVEDAIVSRYNVPVTLFNAEAQTDNNYETAWMQFYDNAVLPTFNIVWGSIARMLSQRVGIELKIKHDTLTNNTLARQAASRAVQLRTIGLVTTNEARSLVGYEPVMGGDALLAPAGEVPIGEDYFTSADAQGRPLRNPPEPARISQGARSEGKRVLLQ
jgi:HK97 family phage portal protein